MSTLKTNNINPQTGTSVTIGADIISTGGLTVGSTAHPIFRARVSANQTVAHNTETQVVFGTETIDNAAALASNTFTCPVAGYYLFESRVSVDGGSIYTAADDVYATLSIRLGGTAVAGAADAGAFVADAAFRLFVLKTSVVALLSVGQTIDVSFLHFNNTNTARIAPIVAGQFFGMFVRSA